jgi:hypothetical protein
MTHEQADEIIHLLKLIGSIGVVIGAAIMVLMVVLVFKP